MKKLRTSIILIINLLLVTVLTLPIKAIDVPKADNSSFVQDFANVITEKTETYINSQNAILQEQTGAEFIIVTVEDTSGYEIEDYTYEMFNEYGVGASDKNNGVLLLLAINNDNYWLMVGTGLENNLTGGTLKNLLLDYLEDDFTQQEYDQGTQKLFNALYEKILNVYQIEIDDIEQGFQPIETINENVKGESLFKTIFNIIIAIVIILAILLIISAVFASIKKKQRYYDPRQTKGFYNPTYHRPTILPFNNYKVRNKTTIPKKMTHTKSNYIPPRPTIKKSSGSMFSQSSRSIFGNRSSNRSSSFRSFGGGRSRGGGAGRK